MSIDLSEFKTNRALKKERTKKKEFYTLAKTLWGRHSVHSNSEMMQVACKNYREDIDNITAKIKQHHATVKLVSQPVNDNKARCAFRKFHKE